MNVKPVATLTTALVHGKTVRVTYTTNAGATERRTVKPVSFTKAKGSDTAIVFKVVQDGEWKSLRSDRCTNVRFL